MAGISGSMGLGFLIAAVFVYNPHGLQSRTRTFLGLALDQVDREDLQNCFSEGMFYDAPRTLPGTGRTVELNPELCQERCQGTEACAHFTFWPDGGCLLTGADSELKASPDRYSTTVTGPKYCQKALEKAEAVLDELEVEESGPHHEESLSSWGGGKYSAVELEKGSVKEVLKDVKLATKTAMVDRGKPEPLPGVNGSTCASYPACVAAGMSQGNCCPNLNHIALDCCDGFPKAVWQDVNYGDADCAMFPQCTKLNMSGACCPAANGENLECCGV